MKVYLVNKLKKVSYVALSHRYVVHRCPRKMKCPTDYGTLARIRSYDSYKCVKDNSVFQFERVYGLLRTRSHETLTVIRR